MSLFLALETSSEACSCALNIDGRIVESYELIPRQHAQKILPMIHALLEEHKVSFDDLDAVAVGQGPGSFTGLRIGVGVAQGIAFGADLPVVSVSTLAALAMQAQQQNNHHTIFCCIDARINEVYWGLYKVCDNEPGLIGGENLSKPEDITEFSLFNGVMEEDNWVGVGTGMKFLNTMATTVQNTVLSYDEMMLPRAADIARLASIYFDRGEVIKPEDLAPVYIRDKVTYN